MGREYKIVVSLKDELMSDIKLVFRKHKLFEKSYHLQNKEHFAFRRNSNEGAIPDFTINFESDGIYICKFDCSEIFEELDELKKILETKLLEYSILDYDD